MTEKNQMLQAMIERGLSIPEMEAAVVGVLLGQQRATIIRRRWKSLAVEPIYPAWDGFNHGEIQVLQNKGMRPGDHYFQVASEYASTAYRAVWKFPREEFHRIVEHAG
jgi:hypothetical protein